MENIKRQINNFKNNTPMSVLILVIVVAVVVSIVFIVLIAKKEKFWGFDTGNGPSIQTFIQKPDGTPELINYYDNQIITRSPPRIRTVDGPYTTNPFYQNSYTSPKYEPDPKYVEKTLPKVLSDGDQQVQSELILEGNINGAAQEPYTKMGNTMHQGRDNIDAEQMHSLGTMENQTMIAQTNNLDNNPIMTSYNLYTQLKSQAQGIYITDAIEKESQNRLNQAAIDITHQRSVANGNGILMTSNNNGTVTLDGVHYITENTPREAKLMYPNIVPGQQRLLETLKTAKYLQGPRKQKGSKKTKHTNVDIVQPDQIIIEETKNSPNTIQQTSLLADVVENYVPISVINDNMLTEQEQADLKQFNAVLLVSKMDNPDNKIDIQRVKQYYGGRIPQYIKDLVQYYNNSDRKDVIQQLSNDYYQMYGEHPFVLSTIPLEPQQNSLFKQLKRKMD